MRTFLIAAVVTFIFVVFSGHLAYAQENTDTDQTTATSSSIPNDNSYLLFWPLTAGKTEGDTLYSLKLFKEQLRGWFIFGDTKKANYAVYLGTKRMMESELLIKAGKNDLAIKTLDRARIEYKKAYFYVKSASNNKTLAQGQIDRDRLINMKSFLDYLKTTSQEPVLSHLDAIKEDVDVILRDYLP